MKKEVRLIFNLDNEKDKLIYDAVSCKSVATAHIKDVLIDYINGDLVNKKEYDSILNHITKGINISFNEECNTVDVTIDIDDIIDDVNEFDD